MKYLAGAAIVVAAFLLGLAVGESAWWQRASPWAPAVGVEGVPAQEAGRTDRDLGRTELASGEVDPAGIPRGGADFGRALDRFDALTRSGDAAGAAALRAQLLDAIRQEARDGQVAAASVRLGAYLARNPHDPEAHLLDADLRQMQGRSLDALTPLLAMLGFEDDPHLVARARDKLRLIVSVEETRLANAGDTAGLVRLFEDLTLRDPAFDGHRLRLAHWLLRSGRLAEAEDVLAQTGTTGAEPQAREDLAAQIRLARTGLPLERSNGALHVNVRVAGAPLRMLVDTGATTTAIVRSRAAALGSAPTGERVRVRTAGGVVESEVHHVRDLEVGGLHLGSHDVLVLDGPLPQGVDGLLGMDVLERFQTLPGAGLQAPSGR